jgi:hypothetical protein
MPHRYVVFAERIRGFDTLEQAERFARSNFPAVICERTLTAEGTLELVEVSRHDYLYDAGRAEWRIMLG